ARRQTPRPWRKMIHSRQNQINSLLLNSWLPGFLIDSFSVPPCLRGKLTAMPDVKLPDLGENIESADVVSVLVKEGDVIKREQDVIEIETEKAVMAVPSDGAGKVTKIHVARGQTIKPGQVILSLEASTAGAAGPAKSAAPAKESAAPPKAPTAAKPSATSAKPQSPAKPKPAKQPAKTPRTKTKTAAPQPKAEPRKNRPSRAPASRRESPRGGPSAF